jgi:hypothetical protein
LRGTRTEVLYKDLADVSRELTALRAAFAGMDPREWVILFDARKGPMRNDPAFEQASRPLGALMQGFKRSAVLVGTATGLLQMKRLGRQGESELHVFDDEAQAMAHLLAP